MGQRDTSANANTPPHSEADDRARPFPPSCSTLSQNHPRMACKGDVRAARMAGKSPPTSPMPHAKTSEIVMTRSVGSKEKTISDQLAMLIIENCTKPMSIEAAAPTAPRDPERAQGADLALATRDRAVHRDHSADHRACREEDRHDGPEDADERGHPFRLLLVERGLAERLEAEALVVLDARAERVELGRRFQLDPHARVDALAVVGLANEVSVAPHLGLVRRPAGVEHAHHAHRPVLLEVEGLIELEPLDAPADAAPDHDLVGAGPGRPARDDVDLGPERHSAVGQATDRDV